MDELAIDHIFPEGLQVKASPHTFDQDTQCFIIGLHNADLMGELLNMPDERILPGLLVKLDLIIHRLLFRGVIHGEFCHQDMATEAVYLLLHRFLKAFHDQKGNDGRRQTDRDTDDSDLVNSG
jgi:hypothetical protein